MVTDSAARSNLGLFPPVVVVSDFFGNVGCTWLPLVLFGLLVEAALNVLAKA
jgi:hypothetical protein